MNATIDHTSLETGKLLKDCGVWSNYIFVLYNGNVKITQRNRWELAKNGIDGLPAFTWEEILWVYHEHFFGYKEKLDNRFYGEEIEGIEIRKKAYILIPELILGCLGQGFYERADNIFRANCILIKKV